MSTQSDSFVEKWHSLYMIMPVFSKKIELPPLQDFCHSLAHKFGKVGTLSPKQKMPAQPGDMSGFMLYDHPVYYQKEDQYVPSQLVLYGPDEFNQALFTEQIISQFWDCADRAEFAGQCKFCLMASNMLAAGLPMMEQYQIMADYADLLLELLPDCIGIYWPHSQRLVPREEFLTPHWNNPALHFLDGGLHVRFFNITGTDEMLFDTLGLTAIGLPDLQCHCKNLEPNDVVMFLRNLAAYLYQEGDVIADGNTVEGLDHTKWLCQREDALVGPLRVVLDIHAGEYAGGGR